MLNLCEEYSGTLAGDLAVFSNIFSELDLHGNVITKLPDVVGELEHLTSINLANNKLSVFPERLTEIQSLERINLEGNDITGKMESVLRSHSLPFFRGFKCIGLVLQLAGGSLYH